MCEHEPSFSEPCKVCDSSQGHRLNCAVLNLDGKNIDGSEYWHEPTNTRLLASALMVVAIFTYDKFTQGEPIRLWEIRPGVSAWTFSYHDIHKEGETFYHWHSSLNYFESEAEAKEAMGNFVRGLNLGWRAG